MAAEPEIRIATKSDLEGLLKIEKRCFVSGPYRNHTFDQDHYEYYLNNPNAIVLVGTSKDGLVASLVARKGSRSWSESASILSVAVLKAYRRNGVGRRIVGDAVSALQRRGCRRCYLEVAASERHAKAFFAALGFAPFRKLPGYYGPRQDGLRMKRDLNCELTN